MTMLTWRRVTPHNQRAMCDDELMPYMVRSYGTNPTLWEVMDIRPTPWRTLKTRMGSEREAKQFAQTRFDHEGTA